MDSRIAIRLLRPAKVVAVTVGAVTMLIPFLWGLLSSFKLPAELYAPEFSIFPQNPSIRSYQELFGKHNAWDYLANSLFVATIVTISIVVISPLVGYVFAKFQFPGRRLLFALILATMLIPIEIYMIPLYTQVNKWGWVDTRIGLIIPFLFDPFGVFLTRQSIVSIPNDYIEAARIDGLPEYRIYTQVIIPLIKPVLCALGIFAFIWQWDSLIWPLVLINSQSLKTIPLLAISFQSQQRVLYDMILTVSAISIWPALIVFLVLRRYFVEGAVVSGLKG